MWRYGEVMYPMVKAKHGLKNQTGSIVVIFILGLAQISALAILSTSYFNKAKKTIVNVNTDFEVENSKSLIMSYFSDERVCTAHFLNRNLVSGPAQLASVRNMQTVGPNLVLGPTPIAVINNDLKNLTIDKVDAGKVSSEFVTELSYVFNPKNKPAQIGLQVELDATGRIIKCRSNMNTLVDESICDASSKGKFIYSQVDRIPKVCDGTAWTPAYKNAGYYSFMTNSAGGVGQCMQKNSYSKGCSCPAGFKSKLVYEFESHACTWKYYKYGSGAGCGAKVMECYHGT